MSDAAPVDARTEPTPERDADAADAAPDAPLPPTCNLGPALALDFFDGRDPIAQGWQRSDSLQPAADGLHAQYTPGLAPLASCAIAADANGMSFETGVRIVYVVKLESDAEHCCETYPLLAFGDRTVVAQLTVGSIGHARFTKLGEQGLINDLGPYSNGEKIVLSMQRQSGKTRFCGAIVDAATSEDTVCRMGDLRTLDSVPLPPTLRVLSFGMPRNGQGIATISRSLRIDTIPL